MPAKEKLSPPLNHPLRSRKLMDPDQVKICSRCMAKKPLRTDFYFCRGTYRSECKVCTIKRNVVIQRDTQAWKKRLYDADKRNAYAVEYYSKNKAKFAEYRKRFKEKHPNYYYELKEKKNATG